MSWLFDLHRTQPIAHALGVLALVCVVGMAFGSLKFKGIGLQLGPGFFAALRQQEVKMNALASSDAPTVAYATVYPLTTLLRILSAQVLAIVLFR